MDILRKRIHKGPAQMGITQTSFYTQNPIVSGISIGMDAAVTALQKCFRIFSTPSRLILEIPDGSLCIFDAAVNPHVRIRCIFSPRFFQHLYVGLIDMQVILFQQFLLQAADHMGKPVPKDGQKPV